MNHAMTPVFEQLLGRAVTDVSFRQQLVNDPEATVKNSGLNISTDEMNRIREAVKTRGSELGNAKLDNVARGEWL